MSERIRLLGGRYELGALLGRGGMAEVHLGYDTRLGREVAIKMLRSDLARDATFLTRFRREAQSSAILNHASIVAVYDSGEDHYTGADGERHAVPYIVMEYVEGRTLRELLTASGRLPWREATRITEGVLDALAYSHRRGIVHRDIKPGNVMIARDGSVKVMDFGIARAIADTNATMTQTQAVIGTAQYLSPEQAQGLSVDARSDLYSAGCMLYELLTGHPPFQGDSPVAIAYQHVGQSPQPPSARESEVPHDIDCIVLHALVKDRTARYQSATDFLTDLQAARLGRPISAAAAGSLAALQAGTTERIDPYRDGPTEVYAASPPPTSDTGTDQLLPVGREEPPQEKRGLRYAIIAIASIVVLALLAFGVKSYLDAKSTRESFVLVPSVTNKPVATAVMLLRKDGFTPEVERETNQVVPVDDVIRQNPNGGLRVEKGSTVTIWVSTGPGERTVPDLVGRTQAEATQILEDNGLRVGTVTQVDNSSQEKGRVDSTSPVANETVAFGSKVNLKVSSGKVTVPDVTGKQLNEAIDLLATRGLRPTTTFTQTDAAPPGQVISQGRKAGTTVDAGSTIPITVAQAKPPTPTPSPSASAPSPSPTETDKPTPNP